MDGEGAQEAAEGSAPLSQVSKSLSNGDTHSADADSEWDGAENLPGSQVLFPKFLL